MSGTITLIFDDDGVVRWKAGGGARKGKYKWIDEPECPAHGRWEYVPAGTRRDGSEYNGFWTCTDDDCLNRPGREWTKTVAASDYIARDEDEELPFG